MYVCGRARGYQKGETLAIYGSHRTFSRTIDEDYVDGLSITYSSNPRQHIWTFASGRGERNSDQLNCPCSVNGGYSPSFVGNNYYCESGSWYNRNYGTYFFNDTLWDGAGCVDNCCDDTTQPWFYRQLNQTTQDDIEARICTYGPFSHRSTLIDQLELYIQVNTCLVITLIVAILILCSYVLCKYEYFTSCTVQILSFVLLFYCMYFM